MTTALKTRQEIDVLLDDLHTEFMHELERQETILAVCRAQGDAARDSDTETLQALTQSLTHSLEEAVVAERVRLGLLKQIVRVLELPQEEQTLSELIANVPENWRGRLQDFQEKMQSTLKQTRKVVRANNRVFRSMSNRIDTAFSDALGGTENHERYDAGGERAPSVLDMPAMLNAMG